MSTSTLYANTPLYFRGVRLGSVEIPEPKTDAIQALDENLFFAVMSAIKRGADEGKSVGSASNTHTKVRYPALNDNQKEHD